MKKNYIQINFKNKMGYSMNVSDILYIYLKQCYKPLYPKYYLDEKSQKNSLSPQRNKDFSNTIEFFDIDKKELQNDIKKSSSFGNHKERLMLNLNTNSFGNNPNINKISNNINLTEDFQNYNFYTYREKNSKLINSLNEAQIKKRLNKIKNVAKDAPILNLIVLSSNYYKSGKHFKIGPYGIINNNKNNKNKDSDKRKKYNCKKLKEDDSFSSSSSKQQINKGIVYFGYNPDKTNKQVIKERLSIENNNKIINQNNKRNKNIEKDSKNKEIIDTMNNNKDNFDYIDIQVPPWEDDKEKEKITQISTMINTNQNINLNISNILENKKYGCYFYIYFNPDYMKYYVKDCGMAYGTFINIQNEIILKDNYIINIGDTFIEISIGMENKAFLNERKNDFESKKKIMSISDPEYNNNLNLKIISKDKIYDPVNFLPTKSKIKIGRGLNCEIVIDDILLSRIHCTIEYKNNIGWIIRDGYRNKENIEESMDIKASTNGTWLYVFEDTPIYEGMILRSDNNLFRCKF